MFAVLSLCLAALPALGQQSSVAEQYLFSAANAERVQRGLPTLGWDTTLYRAAAYHADVMAAHGGISHQFSGEPELSARGAEAGAHFSVIAENVAMAPTAVQIHEMWMRSRGHRENLLNSSVDRVAIRVVRRDGELYAVEDFEHAVVNLSFADQESRISHLVADTAPVELLPTTEDHRRTCAMDSGWSGARQPWFVIRFTSGSLDRLPGTLVDKLNSGRYRQAAVAACPAPRSKDFSAYSIAVLLYP